LQDFLSGDMTQTDGPKNRRRGRRISLWVLGVVILLVAGVAGAFQYSLGRTFTLGPWLREQAIVQFSDAMPGAEVAFDRMAIQIQTDWHPRIVLERLVVSPAEGTPIEFTEAETTLSYRKLVKGIVAPRNIRLSGVFLSAQRAADGQIAVSFGAREGAGNIGVEDLVQQIDRWLTLPQFERLTDVDIDAVTLRFDDLRAERGWTIDGGQMHMEREDDLLVMSSNFALLGGRDYASSLEFHYESELGNRGAQFAVTVEDVAAEDIASQSPALTWLEILRAPISGAMRVSIDDQGKLGPLNATLQIGQGVLQPGGAVRPVPFQSARSYFTYLPESNTLRFDELSLQSDWIKARADGKAHLIEDESGLPNMLLGQFQLTEFEGNPAGVFDAPISLDHVQTDFRLTLDPFELTLGEVLVQDQGQSLVMNGHLQATGDDWDYKLEGHMDALEARRLVDLWPEEAKPKTRDWIDQNIYEGRLEDINLVLRARPEAKPDVYLDFEFNNARLRYSKTLPIVEDGRGRAVWMDNRFVVLAEGGTVSPGQAGPLDVTGTSFVIPDTRIKQPPAEVNLKTSGTITSALSLLDYPPFEFLTKANLPVNLADGIADVQGLIQLPLVKGLKTKDVAFDLTAELRNVRTDHFVPGKVIAAPVLNVAATNESVSGGGVGRIGAVPFDATWTQALQPAGVTKSRIAGTVELSEQFIDEFNIGLSREFVSGATTGAFEIQLEKGEPPAFTLSSDMVGSRLALTSLGWRKSAKTAASLNIASALTSPMRIDAISLDAPGLKASGAISLSKNGGLNQATLSDVRVGNWFSGPVTLIGRGAGRAPAVSLLSGRLNLRNMPTATSSGGGNTGRSTGIPIKARLDRLEVSDGITLTAFNGDFTTVGGFNGAFQAQVNGGARVDGTVVPSNGRSAVRLTSSDAGGVFRAAGILKQVYGGNLNLTLSPIGESGNFDGKLDVKSIRLRDAPAMAALLNAISVIGLLEQLSGDGISFTDVEANFRLSPKAVTLTQGSAVGPSMGLSMDGYYATNTGILNMQGVISPVYILNVVGRPISKKGEGLFGFNYALTGTADSPKVSVNPLSVLTPGIFRDIFRRPVPSPDESGQN
jgi:hypothetical protein